MHVYFSQDHFAVVIFGGMVLFWKLPALPCAYMESLRQGAQQPRPQVQSRACNSDNRNDID